MKIHTYKNYEEYVDYQTKGNKADALGQWCKRDEIKFLSDYLLKDFGGYFELKRGICHGTKQGNEQRWFKEFTGAAVLGTEISDTAEQYPNTIQWDFHTVKSEWIDSIDFIYSNALDHSYDPQGCLKSWMSCIKKTGCCILEWTLCHTIEHSSMIDPFGATREEYEKLIIDCGYKVKEILKYKSNECCHDKIFFIVTH